MSDLTISKTRTNVLGILLALVLYVVLMAITRRFMPGFLLLRALADGGWVLWVALFASMPVHEWLHVAGFRLLGKAPAGSTRVMMLWSALMPAAHCSVPIEAGAYRGTLLLPMTILGAIPFLAALATRSEALVVFGVANLLFGVGDLIVLYVMRDVGHKARVLDHESEVGCRLVED